MGLGVMTMMPREAPDIRCVSARQSLRRMFAAHGARNYLLKD